MKKILWTDEPLDIGNDQKLGMTYDNEVPETDVRHAWEKSVYPLGNGRLGCTSFGGVKKERIQFNEDSLWVGNEHCTGGYQPFGDIFIDIGHVTFNNYRRELDIDRAVQTITYTSKGVNYKREYFASRPAQLIVLRFTANQQAALSGMITMDNIHDIPIVAVDNTLTMSGDTSNFWFWRLQLEDGKKRLIGDREYSSDQNIDLDIEAQMRVLHEGGKIEIVGDKISFENCDAITLLLGADTNFCNQRDKGWRGEHPHERITGHIDSASRRAYEDLLNEHIKDYQSIYGRLSLELGATPEERLSLPTPERIKKYSEEFMASGATADRDLEVLLYQYARYLIISCSRAGFGTLPANLQGLWLMNKHPSWRCDYHTDINIQMNYWFADGANLPECFVPFAEWVDSIREVRKEETEKVLGVKRGWLMRSENGVFGGSTWHIQKGDSAWLCQNLWDHYTYTQDKEYLKRYAYPVMKEISEFWVDHLKELPDGTLVAPDGRSPEHGPDHADGVTYDQVLCWDLFNNTIEASEVLDVDREFRDELIEKKEKLLKPQIGKWGQLQEWMEDIDDPKDDHRHINHLICVYPGRQVHPSLDPELAEAAKVGLTARRDCGEGHPGWSRVWKSCMFARLLDGEASYGQLSETLATHIYPNMWAVHPPFQIDCNFGYAAGIHEILAQSHLGVIHLLPALPKAWKDGSVKGMRVRGGFEIDMTWKDGKLSEAEIRNISNSGGKCQVRYQDKTADIAVMPDCGKDLIDSI